MKVIRYAIRKDDLHSLLRTIGVLQQSERLLAVNNLDLTDQSHDVVVVTVTTEPPSELSPDPVTWTDKQLHDRFFELAILEDVATRQLRTIVEEMNRLRSLQRSRDMDTEAENEQVPDSVERHIRDQLRRLLSDESSRD
jgi:hypothetical protein